MADETITNLVTDSPSTIVTEPPGTIASELPLTLSPAATAEILGDNLCVIFAIGKDGTMVRYYPAGFDVSTFDIADETMSSSVVIDTRIPKCGGEDEPVGFIDKMKIVLFSHCPCLIDGRCKRCP